MAAGQSGSKELKAVFKKAKEAIKGKDFQQALDFSKAVLDLDPDHYHALVFVGKCATELPGLREQADQAYRQAIRVDPTQLLAWQGSCALHEKYDTPADRERLVDVYHQLIKLLGDEAKERQIKEKLAILYQKLDRPMEASTLLHSLIQSPCDDGSNVERWLTIIKLLSQHRDLDEQSTALKTAAYIALLEASQEEVEGKEQLFVGYIDHLLKAKSVDIAEVKECASKMHQKFPSNIYPLEKLAEIALNETYASPESTAWSVYDDLSELDPENGWALIGQAQIKLANCDIKAAKEDALNASKKLDFLPICWLVLARCQLYLHDNKAVEQSTKQGLSLLKTYSHPALQADVKLREAFLSLQGRAWLESGLMEYGLRAVELFQKLLLDTSNRPVMCELLTRAHLLAGDISSAQQSFEEIPAECRESSQMTALAGWLMFHQGMLTEAQEKLQAALAMEEAALYHYWLGRVFWAMGGQAVKDKAKCLSSFLKSAKLDQNYSETFLYLGHHYMQVGKDTVKAKRCYRKAYDLNPASEGAALALGDACDLLDEKEEAISVYMAVTTQAAAGGAKWAWLRLGLVQLRVGKATDAVESFQAVLRADPDDKHCQECLAEAYLSRGSYNAALRAFSRVIEMDPNATYSLFKIGYIKQTLGLYPEAVAIYQDILSRSPNYVPALTGQGETYILMAKAALHEFYQARAVSYIQLVITVLARAAILRPDLCGVWKLLGDACTLLAPLHDDIIRISVAGALLSGDKDSQQTLGKGELLTLGGRCYSRAVQRRKDCSTLWHDLGINYYRQYQWSQDGKTAAKALQFLKKAIALDKTNHVHWTALGVVAASPAIADPGLAQHAFIKSIQLEAKNVVAWTNLGTLYFLQGNPKLANKAFSVAQSLEPSYVQCWIGQSLIAETAGHEEAIDLYRHTTGVATHVEGGLGYADMVCDALLDPNVKKDSELYRYNITKMGAVPTAEAAIGKVAAQVQTSAEAHTLHGILLERQGLHRAAVEPYKQALNVVKDQGDQTRTNIALSNHGRALSSAGKAEEARDTLQSMRPLADFQDILSLALAFYRNKQWPEAYLAYEQALQLARSDTKRSEILTAMAMACYQSGDLNNAKTYLFQSSQLLMPCRQGLVCLCALGLLTEDSVLTNAALAELAKLPSNQPDPTLAWQITLLAAAAARSGQGDILDPGEHVSKCREAFPLSIEVWDALAEVGLIYGATDIKSVLEVKAAAELASGNHGNSLHHRSSPSLVAAQKSVHANPGDVNRWILLGASCSAQLSWQQAHHSETDALADANLKVARFLLAMSRADSKMASWVSLHTVHSMMQSQQWKEAQALSKQILEWCDYGSETNSSLLLLNNLSAWMETKKGSLAAISASVQQSPSPLAWQILGQIYLDSSMLSEAEVCFRKCLELSSGRHHVCLLHQLALVAKMGLKGDSESEQWCSLAEQTAQALKKQAPHQPTSHLLKALLYQLMGKQERQVRKELQQGLSSIETAGSGGYTESILRVHLVELLATKDPEAAKALAEEALKNNDPMSSRLETLVSSIMS